MGKCPDFERLCAAAKTSGWVVGVTITAEYAENPRDGYPGRRELEAVNLRRKATDKPRFVFAVNEGMGGIAAASRKALAMLKGQKA